MTWRGFKLGCMDLAVSFWGGLKSSEFFNTKKGQWVWGQICSRKSSTQLSSKVAAGVGHVMANGVSLASRAVGVVACGLGLVATGAAALGEFALKRRTGRCFRAFAKVLSAANYECDLSKPTWSYRGLASVSRRLSSRHCSARLRRR